MIFVDTGAFLAAYSEDDQYHTKALHLWETIQNRRYQLFTSNFVLDEFFTLLARRENYHYAAARARILYVSKEIEILRPTHEDEMSAVDLFEKYADQKVSFTDCVSFVLIQGHKIRRVFTFDSHFRNVGIHSIS